MLVSFAWLTHAGNAQQTAMGIGVKTHPLKTSCGRAEVVRHKEKLVSCHQKTCVADGWM